MLPAMLRWKNNSESLPVNLTMPIPHPVPNLMKILCEATKDQLTAIQAERDLVLEFNGRPYPVFLTMQDHGQAHGIFQ